ncbi:HAMP domain-containing histidine kinase [Amycolatopsis rubida]|uniref:histidine kinase n=1 Tax=Amycolatopsis rubida TaxID=112413 RepID=A0ABX0C2X3_9PSEU|nr:HAMP domain-containing sensor histidine kinase [Amycolatopsis sp. M39]MYW95939.1 HAMP domain-containing protein [Amycolatopsis rubida]NEC60929.1 HAMP domain-containing histidine kinase [Amycolatopsis rubida]OAP25165.1 Sensor protein BasS [Amycolatopsis sp. M39]
MRRRIVTLTVLAAVLATSLFGLPLAVGTLWYFRTHTTSELERAADGAAVVVSDALADGQPFEVPDNDNGAEVGVYDPAGRLLAGEGPPTADDVVRGVAVTRSDMLNHKVGDEDVLAVPVLTGARLTGIVRAALPRSALTRHVGITWLAMGGCAIGAVLASWLVARRIAARLTRPLEDLAGTATRLGEGDFSARSRRSAIPEIDRVGAALDVTATRIGETLERERAFSAEASHQLRTPLAGLRLHLESALETPGRDPYAAVRAGITAADRLERTVEDLLALSRERRASRDELNLAALLAELTDVTLPGHRELRLEITDPPPVRASAPAVRQVLAVLLDNAVNHGEGTITVRARDAGGALAVDVVDEGPDLGERDPFSDHTPDGHGIGLRLARSLAEAEGGRLRLSRPDPPTFTLLLPEAPAS